MSVFKNAFKSIAPVAVSAAVSVATIAVGVAAGGLLLAKITKKD